MRPSGAACRLAGRSTAPISSSGGRYAAGRDGLSAPQRHAVSWSQGLARCSSTKASLSGGGRYKGGRPAIASGGRRSAMRRVPAISGRTPNRETARATPTLGAGREGRSSSHSMRVTGGRLIMGRVTVRSSIPAAVAISTAEVGSTATANRILANCLTSVAPCGIASALASARSPRSRGFGRTSRSTGWSSIRNLLDSRGPVGDTLAFTLAQIGVGRAAGLMADGIVFSSASAVQGRTGPSRRA